jgi:hypothetical protein
MLAESEPSQSAPPCPRGGGIGGSTSCIGVHIACITSGGIWSNRIIAASERPERGGRRGGERGEPGDAGEKDVGGREQSTHRHARNRRDASDDDERTPDMEESPRIARAIRRPGGPDRAPWPAGGLGVIRVP